MRVIDIENLPLAPEEYDHWFNLTDCPQQVRIEVPDVRRNRIALFAGGMRIGRHPLVEQAEASLFHL